MPTRHDHVAKGYSSSHAALCLLALDKPAETLHSVVLRSPATAIDDDGAHTAALLVCTAWLAGRSHMLTFIFAQSRRSISGVGLAAHHLGHRTSTSAEAEARGRLLSVACLAASSMPLSSS